MIRDIKNKSSAAAAQPKAAFSCSITMKTNVTRGTTRLKLGQNPLYSDNMPSFLADFMKQSIMPEKSWPVPSGFSGWPMTRLLTTSKGLLATVETKPEKKAVVTWHG